jgi:hypothetical protein
MVDAPVDHGGGVSPATTSAPSTRSLATNPAMRSNPLRLT